jgi:hypothetical protein
MFAARSLVIGQNRTCVDGFTFTDTPDGSLDEPLEFLRRLVRSAHRIKVKQMTVILTPRAAGALGFPEKLPQGTNENTEKKAQAERTEYKLLRAWRSDGWNVSELAPWITLWGRDGRATIHLGIGTWLNAENNLFHEDDDNPALGWRLAQFQSVMGVAYHGKPSLPGISLLRDEWSGDKKPSWKPDWSGCTPALLDLEKAYTGWRTPAGVTLPFEHRFDMQRQYLAGARNTRAAMGSLRRTYFRDWSPSEYGYWLITAPVWNIPELPHPAGNVVAGQQLWVTGPTMELLHELARKGLTVAPDVHDSWTTDTGVRDLFRPWVDRIEDAYQTIAGRIEKFPGDPNYLAIRDAIKGSYREAIGMFKRPTSRIHRPDWGASIRAKSRSNLFRVMLNVYHTTGRAPVYVNYDEMRYECTHIDWRSDILQKTDRNGLRADAFPIRDGLGGYRFLGTVDRKSLELAS